MALLLRRYLVLLAFLFWQGGFTFYAAVVVPTGRQVLGSHLRQSQVTRPVSMVLNWTGVGVLGFLALDLALSRAERPRLRGAQWLTWFGMALSLAFLFWLHAHLGAVMDTGAVSEEFYADHRWYLLASALQWACALAFLFLSLRDWTVEPKKAS